MPGEFWIVGGPNGSGKSTWVEGALGEHGMLYLSADQIAAEISPERPDLAKVAAGREFLRRMNDTILAGEDVIVESTLSGRSMNRYLELAKENGYHVVIVFIFLATSNLCVQRVRERVRKGGHDVPEVDIRRRFRRAKVNFWEIYRHQAHEWHLYYNAVDSFQLVATGDPMSENVVDETLFEDFVDLETKT